MKALLSAGFALGLITSVGAQTIVNSDHDLTGAYSSPNGRICIFCHAPHNAIEVVNQGILWNHSKSTQVFTTLQTFRGTDYGNVQDGTSTMACLGCHDGTVAIDAWGGSAGTTTMSGNELIDDLSKNHPVSVIYTAGNGYAATNTSLGTGDIAAALEGGKVECATCHDPHDNSNGDFLVASNANSALCLTCHLK